MRVLDVHAKAEHIQHAALCLDNLRLKRGVFLVEPQYVIPAEKNRLQDARTSGGSRSFVNAHIRPRARIFAVGSEPCVRRAHSSKYEIDNERKRTYEIITSAVFFIALLTRPNPKKAVVVNSTPSTSDSLVEIDKSQLPEPYVCSAIGAERTTRGL